jgi:hypothetical protein
MIFVKVRMARILLPNGWSLADKTRWQEALSVFRPEQPSAHRRKMNAS